MKKTTAKKSAAPKAAPSKPAKKASVKKPAAKKTPAQSAKKCKCADNGKKCDCKNNGEKCKCSEHDGKCDCGCEDGKECTCEHDHADHKCCGKGKGKGFCFGSLISEIFNRLEDTENLSSLLKDYFFTELLKRGIDENTANTLANRIEINDVRIEAEVSIKE